MCDNNLIKLVQNLPNSTAPQLVKDGEPAPCLHANACDTCRALSFPGQPCSAADTAACLSIIAVMLMLLTTVVTSDALLGVDNESVLQS